MTSRSVRRVVVLMIAMALVTSMPAASQAQLVVYDNFNSVRIDPDKWHGVQLGGGPEAPTVEAIREILAGQLRMGLTTYGGLTSSGRADGRNVLRVNTPAGIDTLQAKVTVVTATAEACPDSSDSAITSALLIGAFFNDSGAPPSSAQGDVFAFFRKLKTSELGQIFEAVVRRCANADCSFVEDIGSAVFTKTWKTGAGATHTMRLEWDKDNDQFLFLIDPGTSRQEVIALSYLGHEDTNPPFADLKDLRIENFPPNCPSGRKRASIEARFDDVMVNTPAP